MILMSRDCHLLMAIPYIIYQKGAVYMSNIVEEVVNKIFKAYETKEPIEFIRNQYSLDEKTAYKIQNKLVQKLCEVRGDEVAGYKISMTSPETMAIANTHEPAYGTLFASSIVKSSETISLSNLFTPMIETELMFILTDDITPYASEEEILKKSKIAAGIEIPDARYIDWFPNFSLADLLCDNTATGLVVLSLPIDVPSLKELEEIEMNLYYNGEKISQGQSSAVLGNPTTAVSWLSKKLAEDNKSLKKGMIISSGTFISPLFAKEGTYTVTYSNIGKAEITFKA